MKMAKSPEEIAADPAIVVIHDQDERNLLPLDEWWEVVAREDEPVNLTVSVADVLREVREEEIE